MPKYLIVYISANMDNQDISTSILRLFNAQNNNETKKQLVIEILKMDIDAINDKFEEDTELSIKEVKADIEKYWKLFYNWANDSLPNAPDDFGSYTIFRIGAKKASIVDELTHTSGW